VPPDHPQQFTWDAVDRALEAWLAPQDDALLAATQSAARAGLPEVAVSPAQGRLLEVLARAIGARRILELGTLAGFSTIWLARALPAGGTLVTLELEADRARIARENVDRAGCGGAVEIMVGPAMRSLESMRAAGAPPFDLVFVDADKENCPGYLEHALALSRPGTLIVVDNAIRRGRLIDPGTGDPSVDGVRVMMDAIRRHPRLRAAGIQTVGAKGYDGLVLALVGDAPRAAADPLDILLRHDAWATREVLRACAALTEEQWHRRFEIGPGSLHDTLTHVIGAMLRWADRIDGPPTPLRPSIEGEARRTPAELLAILEPAAAGLAASAERARARGLGTAFDVTLAGQTHRSTLGAALVHVTTHGMHHRAQCLNMLRHLGVPGVSDRLPEIDPLDWQMQQKA
jgi:caffeoyl-CoA O-methyltransferase